MLFCDLFHDILVVTVMDPEKGKNIKKRYKREKYKMRNAQLL